jgi:hypothetical protein
MYQEAASNMHKFAQKTPLKFAANTLLFMGLNSDRPNTR